MLGLMRQKVMASTLRWPILKLGPRDRASEIIVIALPLSPAPVRRGFSFQVTSPVLGSALLQIDRRSTFFGGHEGRV